MCLKRILKWEIFSCAGDRLAQKISLFVESYDYAEAYDVVWSVMTYIGISVAGDSLAEKCLHMKNRKIM